MLYSRRRHVFCQPLIRLFPMDRGATYKRLKTKFTKSTNLQRRLFKEYSGGVHVVVATSLICCDDVYVTTVVATMVDPSTHWCECTLAKSERKDKVYFPNIPYNASTKDKKKTLYGGGGDQRMCMCACLGRQPNVRHPGGIVKTLKSNVE